MPKEFKKINQNWPPEVVAIADDGAHAMRMNRTQYVIHLITQASKKQKSPN